MSILRNPSLIYHKLCRTSTLLEQQTRYLRDYNKVVKLLPKDIEYNAEDDKLPRGPQYDPYLKYSDDEIYELSKVKLEKDYSGRHWTEVDPNEEPYRQVFVGNDKNNHYTGAQVLAEKNVWFWVERLFRNRTLPEDKDSAADLSVRHKPSGFIVQSQTKPDLPYFIPRTRGKLYPVYRRYEIEGRSEDYWKNPWDSLINKWNYREIMKKEIFFQIPRDQNELVRGTMLITTQVSHVTGDIWQLEEDLRGDMEVKHKRRILSAVHEVEQWIRLKGDYTIDVVNWIREKGF